MAVYTHVSDDQVKEFLRAYDVGALVSLGGISSGIENTNYILNTTQGAHILTLYEERMKQEDLPFFLGLMEHVARKGVPSPLPLRTKTGEVLGALAGRPAAIVSFLEGESTQEITPEQCAELGRGLAQFHRAASDFPLHRPNLVALERWKTLFLSCETQADEVAAGLAQSLRQELDYVTAHWPLSLPKGIIHADLFPDNLLFKERQLSGLIDFYFACNDFLAYDLAICFNAWCFDDTLSFNRVKACALLHGYEEVRVLSAAEKQALPLLMRGAALRFLLTRLYRLLNPVPDSSVAPKDPLDYLTRLQFHQSVTDAKSYGIGI